jgi:F420-dependent oxidoreductase-like protein
VDDEVVLPAPCLVVLVGAAGAGKSAWAAAHFRAEQIVGSDALRAAVGEGEDDVTATADAFEILELVVAHRLRRRLTTVVDTLGLDRERRAGWLARARAHDVATVCVVFEATAAECKVRNRTRGKPVPDRIIGGQARAVREQRDGLAHEGFDLVLAPTIVRTVPRQVARGAATEAAAVTGGARRPGLRFGLQIPVFTWPGGPAELRARLTAIAQAAEAAGFESIWVMDHFRQIPMFGPAWLDMPEAFTTLAFLAAVTERVRLGPLVAGIAHRRVEQLAKIVATLDVLSLGRAVCGVGAGWFTAEQRALGWETLPLDARYALLEDALELLPLMWGKGTPSFDGRVLHVPEAMCYPRPLQERVPILVGGNGEHRTLRLVASHADACNVIGGDDVVKRKLAVLRTHCAELGRDPDAIEVTQLSTTLVGRDGRELDSLLDRLRPRRTSAERYAANVNAGTVRDQVARFGVLATAGVETAIVSLPDLADGDAIERFGAVIAAFA